MRNLNDMITAIADELDDRHDEYRLPIQRAIFAALRFCAREPFYFNQTRDVVFNTVAGQAWYDATHHSSIGNLAGLDAVICQRGSSGQAWLLTRENPKKLEIFDQSGVGGRPQKFCYFGQKLRLYPRPNDDGYQIRLQLNPQRFEEITDANQDHVWFIEAGDLIFARAKYELYKNIIKDAVSAAASLTDFHEQLQVLREETSRRRGRGLVNSTLF